MIFDGFVAILAKKEVIFGTTLQTKFFLRESLQNRQKSSELYKVDGFKIT